MLSVAYIGAAFIHMDSAKIDNFREDVLYIGDGWVCINGDDKVIGLRVDFDDIILILMDIRYELHLHHLSHARGYPPFLVIFYCEASLCWRYDVDPLWNWRFVYDPYAECLCFVQLVPIELDFDWVKLNVLIASYFLFLLLIKGSAQLGGLIAQTCFF